MSCSLDFLEAAKGKKSMKSWRDVSAVQSLCYSCRSFEFGSKHHVVQVRIVCNLSSRGYNASVDIYTHVHITHFTPPHKKLKESQR